LRVSSASLLGVVNHGDQEETLAIVLRGDTPWLSASWQVTAPARSNVPLPLDIEIPPFVGAASFDARIEAHVLDRPRFTAEGATRIDMSGASPPTLSIVKAPDHGVLKQATEFVVEARAPIGVGRVELVLTSPSGDRESYLMSRSGDDRFSASVVAREPGVHQIAIRAEDVGMPRGSASSGDLTWSVAPPPLRGFRLLGAEDGASVSIREIAFEEVDVGTVREASYDLGFGRSPLLPPFVASLPPTEGRYVLHVDAVSFEDAEWSRSWNLTLDFTPPSAVEATLEAKGEAWVIHATAPEAANVRAEIFTPQGIVNVSLLPSGGGAFSATVPAPHESMAIRVVAADAAGNEVTTSISSATRGTPAAPLLVVMALVAVCAALRRR
jgi:hypothetical protein